MAPSSNLSFCLRQILSFLLVMLITQKGRSQTSFNISAFTPHSLLLTYEGDAFVPPDTTYVRLVPGPNLTRESVGRVLYSAPVKLWEERQQASIETTFTFQSTPVNATDPYGMTFFMVPVNSTTTSGGIGDNLGIYDAVIAGSAIFAVEFDTAVTSSFEPSYPHIGININSKISQNTTSFHSSSRTPVTARITYDVPTRKISVVATYGSRSARVSFAYNLKALFPQQVHVGLSASTGSTINRVGNFDAFTWHFNSTMVSDVNSAADDNTYIKQNVM